MIADNLYRLRVYKAHLNQIDLASKSGVSRHAISKAERGLTKPHMATIQKLAQALEVEVGELLDRGK
jgi:transcriptional regulator with XRE-family HTH domain